MTTLYLLRHAHAGNPDRWTGDDAMRPLSDKGRRQAERVARWLRATDEPPDLFITSPKVRAVQTAEIVAEVLGVPVVEDPRVAGPLDPDLVDAIVDAAGRPERPCLVGHDPEFSSLLGELIGVDVVPMRKGATARVDVEGRLRSGQGTLRVLLPPELVPEAS